MAEMTNSRILRTIPLLIAVCLITIPTCAKYGGGRGTAVAQAPVSEHAARAAPSTAQKAAAPMKVGPAQIVDYADPTYGAKIRQLRKDDGHEHNFYYYRDPWNADGSRMLGIQSDLQQNNWHVCLYDGNGVFLKELFPIEKYDWRLCWDRNNPDILYTWKGSVLYRFRVAEGKAELLKSFAPLGLKPNGPSCNQTGDRILVITSDGTFCSYHLPDMSDEQTFKISVPRGCFVGWDKPHYIGYRNYIDTAYRGSDPSEQAIVVHDDTGTIVHKFDSIGGGGHYDYSPDGKLAYFKLPTGGRGTPETPFEIHVVNLDGSGDRILFSVPRRQAHFHNLHLSWPSKVNDWFVAGFFPSAANLPAENTPGRTRVTPQVAAPADRTRQPAGPMETLTATARRAERPRVAAQSKQPGYEPPLDEILLIRLDGTTKYLARTGTVYFAPAGRGKPGDMFWAQTLPRPSADGKRICFNSSRSGTIDLCILFLDGAGNLSIGGIMGKNYYGTVATSFWDIQTSGQTKSAGGTGKTTAEMRMASTFVEAGWDFVNVWGIGENQTYPYLRKYSVADINQDASVNFLDLAVLAESWLTGMAP